MYAFPFKTANSKLNSATEDVNT